jgi:LmbE family N-acetylglucosaminyl deacetylase
MASAPAHDPSKPPKVLIVTAHPDDESACAASVYKITHDLHGTVDLAVITDGQGGYKYSTLANDYYRLPLTDEAVGRRNLPKIRRRELEAAGRILGIHRLEFLGQKDNRYTLNVHEALDSVWDVPLIQRRLRGLLARGGYDFVFTMLPTDSTHGHHKAACIMALEAVRGMPAGAYRPVVLATTTAKKGAPDPTQFQELAGYPLTRVSDGGPSFVFDRTQSFGFKHRLNYKIIVNWEIAEHKSQGTMQLAMNSGDLEDFWYFDLNPSDGRERAKRLFDELAVNHYPELVYPGED